MDNEEHAMTLEQQLAGLEQQISAWPGVEASPHRFGGIEFRLEGVEVGHFHVNGMVDIPFNRRLRDQLIAEGRAEPHHLLKDTGWISFYLRRDDQSQAAVRTVLWLFRLSYLFNVGRGKARTALAGQVDVAAELAALGVSDALRAAFGRA